MIVRKDNIRLHRIAECRRQEQVSARRAAAHLGVTPSQVRLLEDERHDLRLSEVYAWQRALKVPLTELLIDAEDENLAIHDRAKLVLAMKSAEAILEVSDDPVVCRHARNLREQLIQVMPELSHVTAWPRLPPKNAGLSRLAEQPVPTETLPEDLHEM